MECNRQLHAELNEAQHLAVHLKEGKYVIAATAGAGKTKVVTLRIEQLLQDGVEPSRIAAFTFTRDAANEMQTRGNALGFPKELRIGTLHSLAYEILREDGEFWGGKFKVDDQRQIFYEMKNIISREYRDRGLDPKVASSLIGLAKANCLSLHPELADGNIDRVKELFKKHADKPWLAASYADLYRKLEVVRVNRGLIDYDDMLVLGWQTLITDTEAQNRWGAKFDYVMVDEAQDSATVQNGVACMLAMNCQNIAMVGDVQQCIPAGELIKTPAGDVLIENVNEGDVVSAVLGGQLTQKTVTKKWITKHTKLLEFETEAGRKFKCTPNHVVFVQMDGDADEHFVYLMHKKNVGWRVGRTRDGFAHRRNSPGRGAQERADRAWIIGGGSLADVSYLEQALSLRYQIPTRPYVARPGEVISDEDRKALFNEFSNGFKLLSDLSLDFNRPAYLAKATSNDTRICVNLAMASTSGYSEVSIESSLLPKATVVNYSAAKTRRNCYRIRRCFTQYAEALSFAKRLIIELGARAYLSERMYFNGNYFRPLDAAQIQPGMNVLCSDGNELKLDRVRKRATKLGDFICYDLTIDAVANYFVGDVCVHNSLYSWRGAKPQEFVDFAKQYKVVQLPVNYRSTIQICKHATLLTKDRPWNVTGPTLPNPKSVDDLQSVLAVEFNTPEDEATSIVADIVDGLKHGAEPKDFAVLYRVVALLSTVEDALIKANVPYVVKSGATFYDRKEVKDVLSYLRVAALRDPIEQQVKRAIHAPFRYLGKAYTQAVEDVAYANKTSFLDAMTQYKAPRENQTTTALKFYKLLKELNEMYVQGYKPHFILSSVLERTRYLQSLKQEEGEDGPDPDSGKAAHVHQLLRIAESFKTSDEFLTYVEEMEKVLAESRRKKDINAVTLSTIHSAKGLEWNYVYGVGWTQGVLPHVRNPDQDEELRLAFVALTRARKRFQCSWAKTSVTPSGVTEGGASSFIKRGMFPVRRLAPMLEIKKST